MFSLAQIENKIMLGTWMWHPFVYISGLKCELNSCFCFWPICFQNIGYFCMWTMKKSFNPFCDHKQMKFFFIFKKIQSRWISCWFISQIGNFQFYFIINMLKKNIYKTLISINFDGHLSIGNLFLKVKINTIFI